MLKPSKGIRLFLRPSAVDKNQTNSSNSNPTVIVMHQEITKQKAMALMGIESSHDFEEFVNRHEEILFAWKQEILQKFMVPSLLKSKLKNLSQMIAAEHALSLTEANGQHHVELPGLSLAGKIDFLESYESGLSNLKLQLMNSTSFAQIELTLSALIEFQDSYMLRFTEFFSEYSEALPEEVNSREIIDTGKLLLTLKQNQIDNKMSWAIEREISRIKKIRAI